MAAADLFDDVVGGLSEKERDQLKEFVRTRQQDLLAARSEDARVRIVEEFIREVHNRLEPARR